MTLTVTAVADALAGVGTTLTPAELAVAEQRVAEGIHDSITAVEVLLDERVGLGARAVRDYPNVAALMGVEVPEPTFEVPDEEPEPAEDEDASSESEEGAEESDESDDESEEDDAEPETAEAGFEIGEL